MSITLIPNTTDWDTFKEGIEPPAVSIAIESVGLFSVSENIIRTRSYAYIPRQKLLFSYEIFKNCC